MNRAARAKTQRRGRVCICAATLALLCAAPGSARAGCLEGADHVKELEAVAMGRVPIHQTGVICLGLGVHGGMSMRWATPAARRFLNRLRRSRRLGRIKRACARIFARGEYWSSRECVRLMADHGVQRLGRLDVFALQQRLYPHGLEPVHLAALGDRRAVPQLMTRFTATRLCRLQRRDNGRPGRTCTSYSEKALRRNRWRRRSQRKHKLQVLNALYHLPLASSRRFLERVQKDDPDKTVRLRAARVLLTAPEQKSSR